MVLLNNCCGCSWIWWADCRGRWMCDHATLGWLWNWEFKWFDEEILCCCLKMRFKCRFDCRDYSLRLLLLRLSAKSWRFWDVAESCEIATVAYVFVEGYLLVSWEIVNEHIHFFEDSSDVFEFGWRDCCRFIWNCFEIGRLVRKKNRFDVFDEYAGCFAVERVEFRVENIRIA